MTNQNETPDLSPMAQELIRSEAPDEALEALLAELEETADELRDELNARGRNQQLLTEENATEDAATETVVQPAEGDDTTVVAAEGTKPGRKHKKINPNVTPDQQAELDEHFAQYWTNSKGSWKNLFRLLREFRAEMQEGKNRA
ncbi:hypothetical protein QYQ98_05075 [Corynebacterium sp. P3-F1]|uniref:hypothetical protein n=1 Tax=Corynebacterium sp. P3-F1 TaxID=3059080 RepID=UPI00265C958E|nr:hypothetical protein [Corynebacterium sp. P3-F1]WKK60457.1 hypothetical protein QYQ98_05075 [Corynebacterium sp. P3-F1]